MSTIISTTSKSSHINNKKLVKLEDLPDDVTTQILELLQPVDISTYAQLNQTTFQSIETSSIWTSIANRYLFINPVTKKNQKASNLSSSQVYKLAKSLSCHWCVSSGLFVAGVPVHRRSGFNYIKSKGGIEIALSKDIDNKDACYVFGGRFSNRAIPTQIPSLDLHFNYESKGPFPVNGLNCRIIYAIEPPRIHSNIGKQQVNNSNIVNKSNDNDQSQSDKLLNYSPTIYDDVDDDDLVNFTNSNTVTQAIVKIKINDHYIHEKTFNPSDSFSELNFHIPSNVLVSKPSFNILSIEYSKDSTAGVWLRDVSLAPTILPLPSLPSNIFQFPLAISEQGKQSKSALSSSSSTSSSTVISNTVSSLSPSTNSRPNNHVPNLNNNVIQDTYDTSTVSPSSSTDLISVQLPHTITPGTANSRNPVRLQQLNNLIDINNDYMKNHSSSFDGERVGKFQNNLGKRPKHVYHKQNQHFRSPRSPRYYQNTKSRNGNRNINKH